MNTQRFLILTLAVFFQQTSCDQIWWPFSWLKIGMQPEVLPKVQRHHIPIPYVNGRPRNIDRFLQQQSQIRAQKTKTAVQPITAVKAVMPWSVAGDSVQLDRNTKRKMTELPIPTTMTSATTSTSTSPTSPSSTTSSTPKPSIDCSNGSSSVELRASTVATSCAPGGNCRIHLRSFQTGDALFQYAYSHASSMDPILQNIYDTTRGSAFAPPLSSDTMIPPEVVKLCTGLIRSLRANRVLVIGVFTGLSVVGAALSIEYGGQVVGVEDPRYVKYWNSIGSKFAFESGLAKSIVIQANGLVDEYLDLLAKTQPNTFDFVVLDDNDMENYGKDYEHALKLLRPKGIMIINDVFAEGSVLSGLRHRNKATEAVADLNRRIREDNRLESSVMIPFGGGITTLVKK